MDAPNKVPVTKQQKKLREGVGRNWPSAIAIGHRGVALTHAELLAHEILPCFPAIDIGFDLVSAHKNVLKRIQVKATESTRSVTRNGTTFCLSRNKSGNSRNGVYSPAPYRRYTTMDADVFVFVHNILRLFYVVPATELDFSRHKISFRRDSKWANAWDVLRKL
jgi:hypothetical protein